MLSNRKISWLQLMLVISIIIAGLSYFYVQSLNANEKAYKSSFNGIIQKIGSTDKGGMYVTIHEQEYIFDFNNRDYIFKAGDSLIKRKNSFDIFQYRSDTLIDTHYFGVID